MQANKKPRLFDIKRLPMDLARLVCSPLPLLYRIKRLTPDGKKYTKKHKGGFIIAANHTSFSDPFIVGCTFWYRRVFCLAAEVVMQKPLRALLLKGVGCIKIERDKADIEAIKKSVEVLKSGYGLIIFPQGGITAEDSDNRLKSGAVLMAMQAGVPIVPIHIAPKQGKLSRRRVFIGDTIYPNEECQKKIPSTKDIETITQHLMDEMNRCKDASQRSL